MRVTTFDRDQLIELISTWIDFLIGQAQCKPDSMKNCDSNTKSQWNYFRFVDWQFSDQVCTLKERTVYALLQHVADDCVGVEYPWSDFVLVKLSLKGSNADIACNNSSRSLGSNTFVCDYWLETKTKSKLLAKLLMCWIL